MRWKITWKTGAGALIRIDVDCRGEDPRDFGELFLSICRSLLRDRRRRYLTLAVSFRNNDLWQIVKHYRTDGNAGHFHSAQFWFEFSLRDFINFSEYYRHLLVIIECVRVISMTNGFIIFKSCNVACNRITTTC